MTARPPAKRLTGRNPLAYIGVEPISPANFIIQLRDPGITDNQNYNIGDIWLNAVTEDPWMLVNLDQGNATWIPFGGGTGILSLTGNTGGPVFADVSNNVNTLGETTVGITVTGNPGTNTLTWTTTTGTHIGLTLTGDVGAAAVFDAMGNIDILGGPNINTSTPGGGSEVEVALNQVIRWTNSNAAGTQGYIYLNGSNGSGGDRFMHNAGGDETSAFLGINSGNPSSTGTFNVGIGFEALRVEGGLENTAVGANSQTNIANSRGNSSLGYNSNTLATGDNNTAIGWLAYQTGDGENNTALGADALSQLDTGDDNIAVGYRAGFNYAAGTSDNILIGNEGVNGESNTIRIGEQGAGTRQQNRNFQAGINGVTVANPATVVIDTITNQLGVGSSSPGVIGDNFFLALQTQTTGGTVPINIPFPNYLMGTTGSGAGPVTMTELTDPDAVFFPGDGTNPATFTAPADGYYYLTWQARCFGFAASSVLVTVFSMGFLINGSATTAYQVVAPTYSVGGSGTPTISLINSAIIPLSAADVVTFHLDWAGSVRLNFTDQSASVPAKMSGPSNWIYGYRVA